MDHAQRTSPCVGVCRMDDANVCIGCARSMSEIVNWARYSDSERESILARISAKQTAEVDDDA